MDNIKEKISNLIEETEINRQTLKNGQDQILVAKIKSGLFEILFYEFDDFYYYEDVNGNGNLILGKKDYEVNTIPSDSVKINIDNIKSITKQDYINETTYKIQSQDENTFVTISQIIRDDIYCK